MIKTTPNLGKTQLGQFIDAPNECFKFPVCCFVLKAEHVKSGGGRNCRSKFRTSAPAKITRGTGEMFESFFSKFNRAPNLCYILLPGCHCTSCMGRYSGWT